MKLKHWAALWAAVTVAANTTAGADPALAAAINDLAARVNVNPDAVRVESRQAVTWPDSSAALFDQQQCLPGIAALQYLTDDRCLLIARRTQCGTE